MSEQSRGPAEPPRDVLAMWERTRSLGKRIDGVDERLQALEGFNLPDALADLALTVKKLTEKPEAQKFAVWDWSTFNPAATGAGVGTPAGLDDDHLPGALPALVHGDARLQQGGGVLLAPAPGHGGVPDGADGGLELGFP
ncbi:hypothetical protein ACIHFC_29690 [Streptomyces sp. NPDC052013]|uniref:hypothetical protein n=1 Tax=Streptomyces sp. NPDC052013 TaxID=3365679 RepID=UPI0037D75D10